MASCFLKLGYFFIKFQLQITISQLRNNLFLPKELRLVEIVILFEPPAK